MAWRQLDEKTVARLVAEATAAPSMHNAQPWRFRFLTGERLLLLYADLERAMPRSDPDNRALHIGCGAALLNLRVAAAHADLVPQIRLLPEPQDPLLLAGVHLPDEAGRARDDDLARLHPAIRERHTSRYPFAEKDVPEDMRSTLQDAAEREEPSCSSPDPGTSRPCST